MPIISELIIEKALVVLWRKKAIARGVVLKVYVAC